MESIWSAFLSSGANCPGLHSKEEKEMEVQELNEKERMARLDSYFSALKELIPAETENAPEEEKK